MIGEIRTLRGAEYVRGYGRALRRQAVSIAKILRGIMRFRVRRAQSKYKIFQNRVMPPDIASL